MDAAGAVDAQNAPTAPWKTAQNAVSHSAHTQHLFQGRTKIGTNAVNSLHTRNSGQSQLRPPPTLRKALVHWSTDRARFLVKLADRAIGACVRLLQYLETSDAPGTACNPRRTGTTFTKRER